ncbi:MAG: hypothetical protein QOG34_2229 [Frankiaceae bacterium]|nr:hypothetical protein [Frankiaceae bacterium]
MTRTARGRFLRAAAVAAAGLSLLPGPGGAGAAGHVLDQSSADAGYTIGIFSNQTLGETFTAGATGNLDQVDLDIGYQTAASVPTLTALITSTSSGLPATTLATAVIPRSSVNTGSPDWVQVAISPAVPVTAGTQYAIVLVSPAPSPGDTAYIWASSLFVDSYSGGTAVVDAGSGWGVNRAGNDMAFKTYVAPPTPPAPTYTFIGFQSPVNNPPLVNTGKGGKTYPVKFQVKDANGAYVTSLSVVKSITATATNCDPTDTPDALEVTATGGTALRYDTTANQFVFNWQTPKRVGCYTLTFTLDNDDSHSADFKLS